MREIEYNGRRFTWTEFAEFVADNLPEKQRQVLKLNLDGIKRLEESIEIQERTLESSRSLLKILPPRLKVIIARTKDTIAIVENAIARDRKFLNERKELVKVLIESAPAGEQMAKALKMEVDSLK
jgi:hypothetical protein